MVGTKKVFDKKDFSNTVVAVFLVLAMLLVIAETLMVTDSLSSAGRTIKIVKDSRTGTINLNVGQPGQSVPLMPVSEGGRVGITIQNPK